MKLKNLLRVGSFVTPFLSEYISGAIKDKQNRQDEYNKEMERLKAQDAYKEQNAVFNTSFWGFVLVLFFNIIGLIVSLRYGNKKCREASVTTLKWLLIVFTTLIVFAIIFFTIKTLCTL